MVVSYLVSYEYLSELFILFFKDDIRIFFFNIYLLETGNTIITHQKKKKKEEKDE